MAATFAFLGMLLVSLVVALLAAFQIGDFFRTGDEFILVIAMLAIFATAAMVAFAIAYAAGRRARTLNWTGFALAMAALAPASTPRLAEWIAARSADPYTLGVENTHLTLELVIPALLAVLVQWGLTRRRWLRARGDEDLTRWPWVTTAVAGLVILNPLGLAVISSTIERSGGDILWRYFAMATAAAATLLFAMGSIECYIRGRILRRRSRPPPP